MRQYRVYGETYPELIGPIILNILPAVDNLDFGKASRLSEPDLL